jgi:predicted amino acid racemase
MEEVLYDVELTADEDDTFKQVDEVAQRIGKEVTIIIIFNTLTWS